jgi:hypothetical protein
MNDNLNRIERRGAQRFEVHQPVAIRWEDRTFTGFTQDLSSRGVFFYCEAQLPDGAAVELTFTMPSEITLGESMPVRCQGHVLRAAAAQNGTRNGIAVYLKSYEYLRADEEMPICQFARISAVREDGVPSL